MKKSKIMKYSLKNRQIQINKRVPNIKMKLKI